MNDLQLIRPKKLCSLLGISIPTLYRWESEGRLPFSKIQIGPGAVGYRKTDVVEYLQAQEQEPKKVSA
jgi:excisionase family DNA binding protein